MKKFILGICNPLIPVIFPALTHTLARSVWETGAVITLQTTLSFTHLYFRAEFTFLSCTDLTAATPVQDQRNPAGASRGKKWTLAWT